MVTIVLFLFLLNFRTTAITLDGDAVVVCHHGARLQVVRRQRELA